MSTRLLRDRPQRQSPRSRARPPCQAELAQMFKPPEWSWTSFGDEGWWHTQGWGRELLDSRGLRLEQWREEGRLQVVKQGPHRVVYRVDLSRGPIYIKHFLIPDRRSMLRQWFRRGKGRNEGKRSRLVASLGIPTITPIALGERRKRGFLFENYLVTLGIVDTIPLDEFVTTVLPLKAEPARSRIRRQLAFAMASMTARLHSAGLLHHDFHPGNMLVRLKPGGEPELVMVDLDALRLRRSISWSEAVRNLALLDHFFWLRSSRVDRWRFLKGYLAERGAADAPAARDLALAIESQTRSWAERLWTRWGKRCRHDNKYFATLAWGPCWAAIARDLDLDDARDLIADLDRPFEGPGAELLKKSRTTTVALGTMRVAGQPARVVIKRFNRRKWIDPFLILFRPSQAWRSWQAGQHLAARGIPTPRNLAYIARKGNFRQDPLTWFLPRETYLVTLLEEGAINLSTYLRWVLPALPPDQRRERTRSLLESIARLIRTLHDRSLSHRDLKASNILIEPGGENPTLIDLVGVTLCHPTPRHRRVRDLARLAASALSFPGLGRADLLRFLRAYLPRTQRDPAEWRSFWRSIDRAIGRKRDRNERRGRPLT